MPLKCRYIYERINKVVAVIGGLATCFFGVTAFAAAPACDLHASRTKQIQKTFDGSDAGVGASILTFGGIAKCNVDQAINNATAKCTEAGYHDCKIVDSKASPAEGLDLFLITASGCDATAQVVGVKDVPIDENEYLQIECNKIHDCYVSYVESGTASETDYTHLADLKKAEGCKEQESALDLNLKVAGTFGNSRSGDIKNSNSSEKKATKVSQLAEYETKPSSIAVGAR